MARTSRNPAGVVRQKAGKEDLTNEQVRHIAAAFKALLAERLPRDIGIKLQWRYQVAKYALVPVEFENDRLVKMYAKKDKKGDLVRNPDGAGFVLEPKTATQCIQEINALWAMKTTVKIDKLKVSYIPEKIESKLLVVPGIVWEWLAPILVK